MNLKLLLTTSLAGLLLGPAAFAEDDLKLDSFEIDQNAGVCEAFGSGYTRVPGTNTCTRVSGYVWSQVGSSGNSDGYGTNSRARLQFDTRTDTEFGELAGRLRLQRTFGD